MNTRIERDSLGQLEVPADSYWGIHTGRALQNFPITGTPISAYPHFITSLATVKQAAAVTNRSLGLVEDRVAAAIIQSCVEIRAGHLHEQFVVDVLQGGAGTSTNMNMNEVLANRALEILGAGKGEYSIVSPHDDVNCNQSTNDTYPSSIKLALIRSIESYTDELERLRFAFDRKAEEFAHVVKMGRTQLQEAVPMTLGREFGGFAAAIEKDVVRLRESVPMLCEVNLGGTAIGTGIAAHNRYSETVRRELAMLTDLPITTAPDLVEASSDVGGFLEVSGLLKKSAIKLSKISNDLRLLSSGPQLGFNEIRLPARQAGSSIMPGKVNPVLPEVMSQVAYAVIGADATVTAAAEAGQLQLNAFEPVIAHSLFQVFRWMENACSALRLSCVNGIEARASDIAVGIASSVGVATALIPRLGYSKTCELARMALHSGSPITELALASGLMDSDELDALLSPAALAGVASNELKLQAD